ncbi:MAG: histidinol-phosphate transaminase [Lachnospiraceae bacterium]|nr:histidinol-phosphate transaminase [Lachnospiraceae bacterium]
MQAWKKNIRKVVPYVPGEQPQRKVIKLNTNENPYPPAPGVKMALEEFNEDCLRLYPDPDCMKLRTVLADYYKVTPDNVFVGVGSDDVLSVAFMTFFNSDKPILFPDITYSFYSVWADVYRIPYEKIPVGEDFKITASDYYKENGGVIFANPNAPTAIYENLEFVEEIVKNNQDVIVIVDEAYIDFGGESAISLTEKYDNLLVVQTFSKSRSMAGTRIGFAIGNPELIKAMNDVKFSINSYTMNQNSLYIGGEAVKDDAYFKETVSKIVNTREKTMLRLKEMGFEGTDSKTNFLFVKHNAMRASEIFEKLKEKDIFVRYFKTAGIDNYLRITIGTDEEMEMLIKALEEIMNF